MVSLLNDMGFPQTRWLHWLAGRDRELSLTNIVMFLLSPFLLLAVNSRAGSCKLDRQGRRRDGSACHAARKRRR